MSDLEIEWTEVNKVNAPSGVYWEVAARIRHPNDPGRLPAVSINLTTREGWTEDDMVGVYKQLQTVASLLYAYCLPPNVAGSRLPPRKDPS